MESIIDRIGGEDRSQHLVNHFHDLIESLPQGRTIMEMHQKGDAPGGVFNQLSQAIAHASATRPVKEVMVFSQRRAMRRKRWIWWMNRSMRLGVTSRVIVNALPEQLRLLALPVLEGGDGRSSLQG